MWGEETWKHVWEEYELEEREWVAGDGGDTGRGGRGGMVKEEWRKGEAQGSVERWMRRDWNMENGAEAEVRENGWV